MYSAVAGNASSTSSPSSNSSSMASPFSAGTDSSVAVAQGGSLAAGAARRVGIAGPRLADVNLLDPAGGAVGPSASNGAGLSLSLGTAGSAKAAVPALQLSRLGSMHAPGTAAAARPNSAGSSSRSRPESAASTSRLAVSARAGGGGGVQHLML
jgi:hypothetical protein